MVTDALELTPLSRWRGSMQAFLAECRYLPGARRELRFAGDWLLLGLLEDELTRTIGARTVSDLPADVLAGIVDRVETYHRGWELAGPAGASLLERLDRHFQPEQERFAEQRARQATLEEQRAADQATLERLTAEHQANVNAAVWGLPAPFPDHPWTPAERPKPVQLTEQGPEPYMTRRGVDATMFRPGAREPKPEPDPSQPAGPWDEPEDVAEPDGTVLPAA